MVATEFKVKDAFIDPYGIPTVQVVREPAKEKFKLLLEQLSQQGLIAAIRGSRGSEEILTIKVFQKPKMKPPRRTINLALFAATIITVFVSGYLLWLGQLQQGFIQTIEPNSNIYVEAVAFVAGLLAIIGLHEFGHKAAAMHHKMDATLPYFVPGFPPIGTFGAVISLRSPPANRDQLFDLGLSGPLVGFIVTVAVIVLSVVFGIYLSPSQLPQAQQYGVQSVDWSSWPFQQPALTIIVGSLATFLRPVTGGVILVNSQLAFAAQIGALLTFLNLVPMWQLDGGHISRSVFGEGGHRTATVIGLLVLIAGRYYPFAFLVLAFMIFSRRGFAGVEPLDDISPVSNSRKMLYVLGLAMLLLTFAFSPF
ncbi:MAG TPA: site-2 protease family protein [Candidatus Bathyarchaeia archaeon]|nr:site-2 protease family protein [Candidatus Bathyarchaeia archaeon]